MSSLQWFFMDKDENNKICRLYAASQFWFCLPAHRLDWSSLLLATKGCVGGSDRPDFVLQQSVLVYI